MTAGGLVDLSSAATLHTLPDDALVARVRGGAQTTAGREALRILVDRYQEKIYLWCYRRLRDRDRAMDAAQDVLLSICNSLESYRGDAPFSAWAFVITRNRCFRAGRNASRESREELDLSLLADEAPDPQQFSAPRRYEETLELVQTELDPLEQRAVWLRCFEELPVDDITRELGLDARSGARGLLQNARRKLRAALDRKGRSAPGGRM